MKLKLVFKINTLYKSIPYKYSLYYLYNKYLIDDYLNIN